MNSGAYSGHKNCGDDLTVLWVLLMAVIGLVALVIWAFNTLVRHRNFVSEAWSGVDVQLRRRHDLIPNLVKLAEAYRLHETSLLTELTARRAESTRTPEVGRKAVAETALGTGLADLMVVVENYPELKANESYLRLQQDLSTIEDDLQMARRYYNGTVRNYNNRVQLFPLSIIAGFFRFRPADFFEITDAAARNTPDVKDSLTHV